MHQTLTTAALLILTLAACATQTRKPPTAAQAQWRAMVRAVALVERVRAVVRVGVVASAQNGDGCA